MTIKKKLSLYNTVVNEERGGNPTSFPPDTEASSVVYLPNPATSYYVYTAQATQPLCLHSHSSNKRATDRGTLTCNATQYIQPVTLFTLCSTEQGAVPLCVTQREPLILEAFIPMLSELNIRPGSLSHSFLFNCLLCFAQSCVWIHDRYTSKVPCKLLYRPLTLPAFPPQRCLAGTSQPRLWTCHENVELEPCLATSRLLDLRHLVLILHKSTWRWLFSFEFNNTLRSSEGATR